MEMKCIWLLACGELPESSMPHLETSLASLPWDKIIDEGYVQYQTDFFYFRIFPKWICGKPFGGPMDRPAWTFVKPGDAAILFCRISDPKHRETLRNWKEILERKGCPYDVFYLL